MVRGQSSRINVNDLRSVWKIPKTVFIVFASICVYVHRNLNICSKIDFVLVLCWLLNRDVIRSAYGKLSIYYGRRIIDIQDLNYSSAARRKFDVFSVIESFNECVIITWFCLIQSMSTYYLLVLKKLYGKKLFAVNVRPQQIHYEKVK